jgi:hypothetical protein
MLNTTYVICGDWSLNLKDQDQLLYHQVTPLIEANK